MQVLVRGSMRSVVMYENWHFIEGREMWKRGSIWERGRVWESGTLALGPRCLLRSGSLA